MPADTSAVRRGEELDIAALSAYLRTSLPGLNLPGVSDPIEIEQFPNGHSNLVYLIRAGGAEYVLRRPPLGPVAPRAHDMAREFRVLRAVHPYFPEAPKVVLLCEDASVAGSVLSDGATARNCAAERSARGVEFHSGIPAGGE